MYDEITSLKVSNETIETFLDFKNYVVNLVVLIFMEIEKYPL